MLSHPLYSLIRSRCTLSELERRSGVTRRTIHNWVAGKSRPHPDKVRKIARALPRISLDAVREALSPPGEG